MDLVHLVTAVPKILSHQPQNLNMLISVNKALRSQVHQCVTHIAVQWDATKSTAADSNETVDRCLQDEFGLLIARQWPCLQSLDLDSVKMQAATMLRLSYGKWTHPCVLNLSWTNLDTSSLLLLVRGEWALLQHLNLSGTHLHTESMAALCLGDWPLLKTLIADSCALDQGSIMHLTSAPWPQLETLNLAHSALLAADIYQLSKGNWRCLRWLSLPRTFCIEVSWKPCCYFSVV